MFENAFHTVMIGHHDQLACVAKESIPYTENLEQRIVDKLKEISNTIV